MDVNKAIERCKNLVEYGLCYSLENTDLIAIDIVLNELELYKKAVSKMAIHLGIADTDFKNMELEEIINHFLGR